MPMLQKRYTHTIAVDFNGKTYEVTADVLLRRKLGPADEPYIVNSSLLSYGTVRMKREMRFRCWS